MYPPTQVEFAAVAGVVVDVTSRAVINEVPIITASKKPRMREATPLNREVVLNAWVEILLSLSGAKPGIHSHFQSRNVNDFRVFMDFISNCEHKEDLVPRKV